MIRLRHLCLFVKVVTTSDEVNSCLGGLRRQRPGRIMAKEVDPVLARPDVQVHVVFEAEH